MMPYMVFLAFVALVATGLWVFSRSRQPQEQPVYHFRCTGCKRRLRYRAHQVGKSGMCPRCRQQFVFPVPKNP